MAFALYHPAAALRSTEVERQSYDDVALIPAALLERARPARATRREPAAVARRRRRGRPQRDGRPRRPCPTPIPDVATDVTLF